MDTQLESFIQHLREIKRYSLNTIAAYQNDLSQFIKFIKDQGDDPTPALIEITDTLFDDYVTYLNMKKYSYSTIVRKIATLKTFSKYLDAQSGNRRKMAPRTPKLPYIKQQFKVLTRVEVNQLLRSPLETNLETPLAVRDNALLTLLYATGMRVTELAVLDVSALNLNDGHVTCGERERQIRSVPIDKPVVDILEKYLTVARASLVRASNQQKVFVNHRGVQLTRQGVWLIIKTHAQTIGLGSVVTPHALRHTFAVHHLESGTDLQELQRLLGHANKSTTQIYFRRGTTPADADERL